MDSEQADIIAKRDEVKATLADTEAKAAEYEAALQASSHSLSSTPILRIFMPANARSVSACRRSVLPS